MKKFLLLTVAVIRIISTNAQIIGGGMLDINNIKAGINADGILFWNGTNATFEVPKGSGKQTILASSLWIGGYDDAGLLRAAAQTYRQSGVDFFPGPGDISGIYGAAYDLKYNRVWKIRKCDIDIYSDWVITSGAAPLPEFQDSTAMEVIIHWPAFDIYGTPLAPFTDVNADGAYDPTVGDVPLIPGDQAVFFVHNDFRSIHSETGGLPLGIEVHGMAYAYNCTADNALNNTIFTKYKIINKSGFNRDSVFIGNWSDLDIGYYKDDYVGCDVARGAYYGYNGTSTDGSGQAIAYGDNPPAQAVVFLKGPYADPNGIDDPQGTSPNALNCGDGIVDNERLGMSKFVYFNNNTDSVNGNPVSGDDFYQYLSGTWKNGAEWRYGGDGTTGVVSCDFMFPGNSDSVGLPAWDELSENNVPGDRRGLGSYGPFTLNAGASAEVDFAYVYGRATAGGPLASVDVMKSRIDSIRQKFLSAPNNVIAGCACSNTSTGINKQKAAVDFVLYPNPALHNVTINYKATTAHASAEIYDATGRMVKRTDLNRQSEHTIAIKELSRGLYILKIQDGDCTTSKRFLKE